VINRERADYVKCWEELDLLPGVLPALAHLATLGAPVLLVSNQSAVGRGLMTGAALASIHQRLRQLIEDHGGRLDGCYVCPHHPEAGCGCRKPKPGLLLQAAADWGLDLARCLFIGDALSDYQAAAAAGCQCCLVATGRQGPELMRLAQTQALPPLAADLATAVSWIVAEPERWPVLCVERNGAG
jgi:D-glycero-D-manno-heptose 1,7-bisphosphate phosphatase